MADLLDKAKDRIDKNFVGRGGIHGAGLRRSQNAVTIYVDPSHEAEAQQLMEQLRAQAAPFRVIVVQSAPAVGA